MERATWPWLIALLLLIGVGILLWLLLRGDDNKRAIPSVVGMPQPAAIVKLQRAGFKTKIVNRFSTRPEGTVIDEDPGPGRKLAKGSFVTVVVSRGRQQVAVPNLISLSQGDAVSQLTKSGLNPDVTLVPSSQRAGRVIAQNPAAGTQVSPGATVRINVSKGRTTTTVQTNTTKVTTVVTTTRTSTLPTTTVVTTTTVPATP